MSTEAEEIVRALADSDPIASNYPCECTLCMGGAVKLDSNYHAADCPWVRARRWVEVMDTA